DGSAAVGTVSSLNSLTGGAVGDMVSSNGLLELSNHNVVVASPNWGGTRGAATLISGVNGQIFGEAPGTFGAEVSATNSLVGSAGDERVSSGGLLGVGTKDGSGLSANYLVLSPVWGNTADATSFGTLTNRFGAVSWGNGAAGLQGAVSAANSLVGDHAGDYIGSYHSANSRGASQLYNVDGYFDGLSLVNTPWVANLSATVDVLANGNYVVRSASADGGKGAVTWADGGAGVSGTVTAANSLVGSVADVMTSSMAVNTHADGRVYQDTTYKMTTVGDHVGLLGQELGDSSYVVASPFWNGGRGALTWVSDIGANRTGTVGAGQSLVGSTPDTYSTTPIASTLVTDASIPGGASVLPIYAVIPGDHLGMTVAAGTYFNAVDSKLNSDTTKGTTSVLPVGPLLMATASQIVQTTLATWNTGGKLTGFNYSMAQPELDAVLLSNGNLLVGSAGWNNAGVREAGAVTFVSQGTGLANGALSADNSLVGSHAFDRVGIALAMVPSGAYPDSATAVTELAQGGYVMLNSSWNNGGTLNPTTSKVIRDVGNGMGYAILGSSTAGVVGTVSADTALVGSQYKDEVGNGGVTALPNGNYAVSSPYWANGSAAHAGAVSWGSGSGGAVGAVSASNSLVGSQTDDQVGLDYMGWGHPVQVLADGNYIVSSMTWANGAAANAGAVTWVDASNGHVFGTGSTGAAVSAANSLVGTQEGDFIGYDDIAVLAGGRYAVASSYWANGDQVQAGAVTFGQAGGVAGAVSAANSLVGTLAGSGVGGYRYDPITGLYPGGVQILTNEAGTFTNYLVTSPNWSDPVTGEQHVGAVTWVDGSTGYVYGSSGIGNRGAEISWQNSLVGSHAGDSVGGVFNGVGPTALVATIGGVQVRTGDALVTSSSVRTGDLFGAVTLIAGDTGMAGRIGWRNSILGFNDAAQRHTGALNVAVLPYAATADEAVSYRPLIWTTASSTASDNASLKVLSVVNEATATPYGTVGHGGDSTAANDGAAWASNGAFLGNSAQLSGYGYTGDASNGLLAFGTFGDAENVVITPFTLTSLLNAGTNVTLQANNDISVLKPIIVSAGGNGGNLRFEAGRSIDIDADIFTDNGDFSAVANQSHANGVLNASGLNTHIAQQFDSDRYGSAHLSMARDVTINTGSGSTSLELLESTDKAKSVQLWNGIGFGVQSLAGDANGDILLGSVTAGNLLVNNAGGAASVSGDILTNASGQVSLLKGGLLDGRFDLRAWRDVVLGNAVDLTQTVRVDQSNGGSGAIALTLQSDQGDVGVGADMLSSATIATHGGDITIGGGGALDGNGRPVGAGKADDGAAGNGFVRSAGVSVTGISNLDSGSGAVRLTGTGNGVDSSGVMIESYDPDTLIALSGSTIAITGRRGMVGYNGAAITLFGANIGDSLATNAIDLRATGYGESGGSIESTWNVFYFGTAGSVLTVASADASSTAQFGGGSKAVAGGLWVAGDGGMGGGGMLGSLLRGSAGVSSVVLGAFDQVGSTTLQNVNMAVFGGGIFANVDVAVRGGAGGLAVLGASNDFTTISAGHSLTLSAGNGGTLDLGTSTVKAKELHLAAQGTGSVITQTIGGKVTSTSLLFDAADATVALANTGNTFGTVAGNVGSGQIVSGGTLHVGTVHSVAGLTSTATLRLRAASDLVLDRAVTSTNGDLTLVAGNSFVNNVALDQGLLTPNGRYLVYSQAPTNLGNGDSARGMS
ncbi:MAG: filamentous hemagglutinin family outer membrane protein, partial [Rhizobacter sp.]|nr:filamentous hemagglutinin family outer membrane protein [Rhizobacter sp.]